MKKSLSPVVLGASLYESPIGEIQLLTLDSKLCYLDFADNPERMKALMGRRFGDFVLSTEVDHSELHNCLTRYFAGDRNAFAAVSMSLGGTPFQRQIWKSLQEIPHGQTMDYSSLAKLAGNARAIRAAASSNARNPISIIVPCHRVIGKDGSLCGYAGGEHRKKWLLELEGAWPADEATAADQQSLF